jgi:SsrA-binding protein
MIIDNRKARYNYHILEEFVAGIKLVGSEVKSIRAGNSNITDSYVVIDGNDVVVKNMWVSKWKGGSYEHEENSDKILLLNKSEINKIKRNLKTSGITIVPLRIFITKHGLIKVAIGIVKGKKTYDKKDVIKSRDIERQTKLEY